MADVVVLGSDCWATRVVAAALRREFGAVPLILEPRVPRGPLFRRRMATLGARRAVGQALFVAAAMPVLAYQGRRRTTAIALAAGLEAPPIPTDALRVPSANAPEAHRHLRRLAPEVVVVSGTRILSRETLHAAPAAVFLNLHAGVTPWYRGAHGGYWALADGRPDRVGTTVHVVDEGVDTGPVLAQATFSVSPEDSLATYPHLHMATGLPLLLDVLRAYRAGKPPAPLPPASEKGAVWTHPTLGEYLWRRWRSGVR